MDLPIPYEPDQDIVPFEEADVATRAKVSLAAGWLFEDWPSRFIECCQAAEVEHPALNRNNISVRSYLAATIVAYDHQSISTRKKAATSAGSEVVRDGKTA